MSKTSKAKKDSVLMSVLLVVCVLVFVYAAVQLYAIFSEYNRAVSSYDEVAELAISVPEAEAGEEEETISYEYYYVDFEILSEQNSDIVAWIRFDAPEIINYPVVQTEDNSTYLTQTFTGEQNSSGTLFVDVNNASDFLDKNTIIYGHNMKNDSMFGALSEYASESFYQECPYFYIYTPDGKASKYQVVAAEVISAYDTDRYSTSFATTSDFQTYINSIYTTAYYDTGVVLDIGSKLVTLSTCTSSDDQRFIVQGVKIETKDMVQSDEAFETEEEEEVYDPTPLELEFN